MPVGIHHIPPLTVGHDHNRLPAAVGSAIITHKPQSLRLLYWMAKTEHRFLKLAQPHSGDKQDGRSEEDGAFT
jgi:hypothetical protein